MARPTDDEIANADSAYQSEQVAEWRAVRTQRNALLSKCDWTQVTDAVVSAENVAAWATYRQALRVVPQTQTDPDSIAWPTPPFVL